MIFVRYGPRYMTIRTDNETYLKDILIEKFNGIKTSFDDAIQFSKEGDTVVFIAPTGIANTTIEDASHIILIRLGSSLILSRFINLGICDLVDRIAFGPGLLIMRIPESGEKVIEKIQEKYNGKIINLVDGINEGESSDTLINFSYHPLRDQISKHDVIAHLLVNEPVNEVYNNLRRDAVLYITSAIEDTQWYEVRINIYDIWGKYDIHYKRLITVLRDMEAGLVLGESWTLDHAIALLSVPAYQIKLFTMLNPVEIKEILMGLEYDSQGNRLGDFDIYYKNSKIYGNRIIKKRFSSKEEAGKMFRSKLFSRITPEAQKELMLLEENLIKNHS